MALKALAYMLPGIDFCCYLGDYTWGASTTTIADTKQHIAEISKNIDEAFRGMPQFRTVGNHDAGAYAAAQNGATIPDAELYQMIGKYCDGATFGSTTAGYCYRDFDSKKLRVICLNTSESLTANTASTGHVSDAKGFTLSWDAGKVPEVQHGIAFAVKGTGANLTVTLTEK